MSYASVYLDESCSHVGSNMLCVAGFLFERDHASQLDTEWRTVLDREGMPYMRMSLFTKQGQAPYSHLPMTRRDEIARELIGIVRRHRSLALVVGINEKMCARVLRERMPRTRHGQPLSPYAWCLLDCQKLAAHWARSHDFMGKIAYFFEDGHKNRANATEAWDSMFEDDAETRKKVLRYGSHTFLAKEDSGALQAADMLAWLSGKWFRKGRPGTRANMRKDLEELLTTYEPQHRDSIHWWTEERLTHAINSIALNISNVNEVFASLALEDARNPRSK